MRHFFEDVDGWFWFKPAYEQLLAGLPADRASIWVELGNYKGRSLAWLIVAAAQAPKQVGIFGVDVVPQLDQRVLDTRAVFQIVGDSAASASSFANESVDVVWVDADHSFAACRRDIEVWWPKLRKGGWMGGDDYAEDGVMRAVTDWFGDAHDIGQGVAADGGPWPYWLARKT